MRTSAYGFYCSDCGKWTYTGYDSRDKIGLPNDSGVCCDCAPKYENKVDNQEIQPDESR